MPRLPACLYSSLQAFGCLLHLEVQCCFLPLDVVGRCCGCFDLRHRSPLSEPERLCLLCLLPLPRFESHRVRPWCWSLYPRLLPLDISLYRFGVFVVCGLIPYSPFPFLLRPLPLATQAHRRSFSSSLASRRRPFLYVPYSL